MEDDTEVKEELCIESRKSRTEYDAAHPRFLNTEKKEKVEHEYELNNYYYCDICKLFFAPNDLGLRTHFKKDRADHVACGNCIYCNGPVYYYYIRNEKHYFHNCKRT